MNDPKQLWQQQPAEPLRMSTELLKRRYRRFENKRRIDLFATWSIAVLAIGFAVFVFARTSRLPVRGVCVMWMLWAVYIAFQAGRRLQSPGPATELTANFYRANLVKKQAWFSEAWNWFLLPTLGCATASVVVALYVEGGHGLLMKSLPFLVLFLIWLLILPLKFRREQQNLQLEIDTLDALID